MSVEIATTEDRTVDRRSTRRRRLGFIAAGVTSAAMALVASWTSAWASGETYIDSNADGFTDGIALDRWNDGFPDVIANDRDQNGVLEAMMADRNNDGHFDVIVSDTQQNGVLDFIALDTDFDGVFDRLIRDGNEDGLDDSTATLYPIIGVISAPTDPSGFYTLMNTMTAFTGQPVWGSPNSDGDAYADDQDAYPYDSTRR